jgi:hypothetical protein
MFLKAFNLHVSKYNESIEKNLAPIREGGSFYLKRIAIIYLIFFVLFIISFILFTIAEHKLTNMNIIAIIALSTMALSFGAKVIKARIKINKINR